MCDIFRLGRQVDYEVTKNTQKYMNNTVENDFFAFPKVKWLHHTGEVDKYVMCPCQILLGFNITKITKIG